MLPGIAGGAGAGGDGGSEKDVTEYRGSEMNVECAEHPLCPPSPKIM